MGIGFVIKKIRLSQGMSQRELARRANISQAALSYIETKNPERSEFLPRLADALGVSPEEIVDRGSHEDVVDRNSRDETVVIGDVKQDTSFIYIPEYDIAFSAGDGSYVEEVVPESTPKAYSLSFFQNRRINPDKCKRYKVTGDSMEPLLYDGDSVLAYQEPLGTRIRDGYVYVVRYGAELRIKRLTQNLDGSVTLRSVNPAHKDFTISAQDVGEHFAILGRVIDKSGPGGLGG